MATRKVRTEEGGPVIVEPGIGDLLHLRLGEPRPGETRYTIMTRSQTLRVAVNLLRAVTELEST